MVVNFGQAKTISLLLKTDRKDVHAMDYQKPLGILASGNTLWNTWRNMSTKDLKEMDSDQRLGAQEQRLARSAAFHSSVVAWLSLTGKCLHSRNG